MKLACIAATDTPYKSAVAGKLEDREWRVLLGAPPMMDLLPTASLDDLYKLYESGLSITEEQIQFMPPVTPTKILAIGQNYMDHIREQNGTPPAKPLIFAKMPSSVIAHGSMIEWNPAIATAVDYEAELAVVIGRSAKNIPPEEALNYVFGYTCAKLNAEPAPMLLGFIIGPMMEEYLRRALLLSHSDPLVFVQRPISATMLGLAVAAMVVVMLPTLKKKREEAFHGD